MTKIEKFLKALEDGKKITIKQAVQRYGFSSSNSVTGTVCYLRNEGINITGAYVMRSQGRKTFKYFLAAA